MLGQRNMCRLLIGVLALAPTLAACNIQAQPFANGTSKAAGPVAVALDVQPNPPRVGQQAELRFTLRTGDQPVVPSQATCELTLDMPKMPMNMQAIPLEPDGNGRCQTRYTFPMAGGWSAKLKVGSPNGAPAEASFEFDVGP